jgi:hypothetical protein
MFGNKETGNITFYYDSDKLFNDVSLMSAYMTKNIASEKGSLMDEYNISDDEKDVYKVCVRQTLPNIYETMIKITSGIDSAFNNAAKVQEKEEEGLLREGGTYIEFTIKDNGACTFFIISRKSCCLSARSILVSPNTLSSSLNPFTMLSKFIK